LNTPLVFIDFKCFEFKSNLCFSKTMTTTGKNDLTAAEVENSGVELVQTDVSHHELAEKVFDGDEALKVLHSEFEAYTAEEEKRVLRKIDRRMIIIMLLVNGLQFVDKSVRLP
jgi:hypothetical protein